MTYPVGQHFCVFMKKKVTSVLESAISLGYKTGRYFGDWQTFCDILWLAFHKHVTRDILSDLYGVDTHTGVNHQTLRYSLSRVSRHRADLAVSISIGTGRSTAAAGII